VAVKVEPGVVFRPEAYVPSVHAASVCALPSGELMASWFGGTREGAPDTAIWGARFAGGAWSEPRVIVDTPGRADGNSVVWLDGAGALRMWWVTMEGRGWATCRVRELRSGDGGVTWGCERNVRERWGWMVRNEPLAHGGRIVMPMYDERHWFSFMLLSDDGGETWARSERLLVQGVGLIQPAVAPLSDGRLLAFMRSTDGWVYASRSEDARGEAWSRPERTSLPNPNSAVELIGLRDGSLLCVYNPTPLGRTPLRAAVSRDDGSTWETVADIETDEGEYSYPTAVETSHGVVHVLYTQRRETIAHVRIEL